MAILKKNVGGKTVATCTCNLRKEHSQKNAETPQENLQTKTCAMCGNKFVGGRRAVYCKECARIKAKERQQKNKKPKRESDCLKNPKSVSLFVSEEMLKKVKIIAESNGDSVSSYIRELIWREIDKKEGAG